MHTGLIQLRYQSRHLLEGFILDPTVQLKAIAKSSLFDMLPMALKTEQ